MKHAKLNSTTHIIEVPIPDFKIILNDSRKKSAASKNYCNAGFFANFSENGQPFTLPVAHLICDYDATSASTKKYCTERGKFNGDKFTFDSSTWSYGNAFYKKAISTLLVNAKSNKAEIKEVVSLPTGYTYAISGIPIMRDGLDVKFDTDVVSQGWDGSPLYATWHIFIGLKKDSKNIYIIGMQTTTWNMVKTAEAFRKFKEIGMFDVIKLDGGGSFHMNASGKTVASTSEDRRINTIISFDGKVIVDDNKDDDKGRGNIDKDDVKDDKVSNETNKVSDSKVENVNNQSAKPNNFASCPIKIPFLKRKNRANDKLNKKLNLQYKDLSE